MATREERRAKIIELQAAREMAARAAGTAPPAPTPRPNWAASPPVSPRRGRRGKPERR